MELAMDMVAILRPHKLRDKAFIQILLSWHSSNKNILETAILGLAFITKSDAAPTTVDEVLEVWRTKIGLAHLADRLLRLRGSKRGYL